MLCRSARESFGQKKTNKAYTSSCLLCLLCSLLCIVSIQGTVSSNCSFKSGYEATTKIMTIAYVKTTSSKLSVKLVSEEESECALDLT